MSGVDFVDTRMSSSGTNSVHEKSEIQKAARAASCQQTIFKQIYLDIRHFLDTDMLKYSSVLKLPIIRCTIYLPYMEFANSSRLLISPWWFSTVHHFTLTRTKTSFHVYPSSRYICDTQICICWNVQQFLSTFCKNLVLIGQINSNI